MSFLGWTVPAHLGPGHTSALGPCSQSTLPHRLGSQCGLKPNGPRVLGLAPVTLGREREVWHQVLGFMQRTKAGWLPGTGHRASLCIAV